MGGEDPHSPALGHERRHLLAFSPADLGSFPCSRKGELLASRKDFRMNTCTPHHSGLFMLELAGLSPTQYQAGRNGGWGHGHPTGDQSLVPTAGSVPMEISTCETPVLALDFSGEGSESQRPNELR
ncbi:hypothetical protein L345_17539, partial [Ophiophagus hannah]